MKFKCTIIFFFGVAQISRAQTLAGRIADATDHKPIPFVYVYLNSGAATITNEDGLFVLHADASRGDTLILSHVGYEKRKMVLDQTQNLEIELNPLTVLLDEVVVYGFLDQVIDSVYAQIKKTDQLNYGKGFYRQVTFNNNVPTEVHEIFLDMSFTSNGIKEYTSREARFAKKKSTPENPMVSFANQLQLIVGLELAPASPRSLVRPFNPGYEKDVVFELVKKYSSNQNKYWVLSFAPKDSLLDKSFTGTITINRKNHCICNYDAETSHHLGADTIRFSSKVILPNHHRYRISMGFDCDNTANPKITYAVASTFFDVPNFGTVNVNAKLIIYETDEKRIKRLKSNDPNNKDLEMIKNTKYHPDFWLNNEIIRRTPLEDSVITSFGKSNAFGNYVFKSR